MLPPPPPPPPPPPRPLRYLKDRLFQPKTDTISFPDLAIKDFKNGDKVSFRAYGAAAIWDPRSFNKAKSGGANIAEECDGPANEGGFGECCDADAQCRSGLMCNTARRYCTKPCETNVGVKRFVNTCPADPSDELTVCQPSMRAELRVEQSKLYPTLPPFTCKGERIVGFSYGAFCSQCKAEHDTTDDGGADIANEPWAGRHMGADIIEQATYDKTM